MFLNKYAVDTNKLFNSNLCNKNNFIGNLEIFIQLDILNLSILIILFVYNRIIKLNGIVLEAKIMSGILYLKIVDIL
jgi:hypothetical protein